MESKDGSDRRHCERVRTEGFLRAQLAMEAEVLTISSRGMMVRLAFAPQVGSHHSFTLTFADQVIAVLGTIRNVEPVEDENLPAFDVGVEFEGIGSREENSLERYVIHKLANT
jgi:hypothetical protein